MFILTGIIFSSCDDDDKSNSQITGEWISDNGDIYYQFNSNGTGRYICLADEPGYNPEYPEAAIKHPVDPYYFNYSFDGETLRTREYDGNNKEDYTDYTFTVSIEGNILQMKSSYNSKWEIYRRYK